MKKFALLVSFFIFLCFNFNIEPVNAQPNKTFSEGIYTIKDLNLLPHVSYHVQNVSGGEAFISILNANLVLEQSIRFAPSSLHYVLNPMEYNYKIVIVGSGKLSFSAAEL